ncbi:MAG: primosomal protein N' [Elainellaceae cyanobacterium]
MVATPLPPSFVLQEPPQPYAPSPQWGDVLVDSPSARYLYTYRCPEAIAIAPGDILSVPFGSQQLGGVAVRLRSQSPELDPANIRTVEDVVSRGFFPADYWTLMQRVADYYCAPLMSVIRAALPPGLLGQSQRRVRLKRGGPEPAPKVQRLSDLQALGLSPAAQQILGLLQQQPEGDYSWLYLRRQVKGAARGLRQLQQLGWVESYLAPPSHIKPKRQQAVILTGGEADLTPRQKEVLEVLQRRGGDLWLQELLQLCGTSSSTVKALERKGCVTIQEREVLRAGAGAAAVADPRRTLTPAQSQAVQTLESLAGFHTVLLHGVTGSGKTEVYLRAIAAALEAGRSVLLLVPEIGLTPQLTDRVVARFGDRVRVYHSGLSDGERYDAWRLMLQGAPQVVIGTRSAVFAPLPSLGLIILDEEHDGSYKQDQPIPCYHARTVARWRAELAGCPLVLGSATPSLESWVAARPERSSLPGSGYHYLSLPKRVADRPLPKISVVDMRQELHKGNRSIFSYPMQDALTALKTQQRQGILFIHRRGHSTFVSCRACGHVLLCPHCDVSLTYHRPTQTAAPSLRCHYCSYGRSQPETCPECDSSYLKHFGSGTQRVIEALGQQFPELRCLRFDSDTTRTKGAHRTLLTRFARGEADLLVGTQMLTKGIDLPQVTLVGVVTADGLLHQSDYRASERAYQLLTQVAGRAGRGDEPGRVIVQTYSPEHPVIEAVQRQDEAAFLQTELSQREALGYPPYGQLIGLRFSGTDEAIVQQTAEAIAGQLQPSEATSHSAYQILGPAPATILRVARRYRWQLLIKCAGSATDIAKRLELTTLRARCPATVSVTVDVDPLNIL